MSSRNIWILSLAAVVVALAWMVYLIPKEKASESRATEQKTAKKPPEQASKIVTEKPAPKEPKTIGIYQYSNPEQETVLTSPTKAVAKLPDPEIDQLIVKMHAAMAGNMGGGISANQIGQSLQIFLIGPPPMINSSAPSDVFINPVITKTSSERSCFWHGCLSSKGEKFGKVASWNSITIEAYDPQGNKFTRELKGLDAIVAQHEFAHLLGRGYHHYAKDFEAEMNLMKKMMKREIKMIEACDESAPFMLEGYQLGETIESFSARQKKLAQNN